MSGKSQQKHAAVRAIESQRGLVLPSSRISWTLRNTGAVLGVVTLGVAINLLQLLTLPFFCFSRTLSHHFNSFAFGIVQLICQYMFELQYDRRMTFSGIESIPQNESAFVISNHAFFGDFALIQAIARRKGMMHFCRYFVKDSIKYIPIFGWGLYLANCPFLKRDWQRDSTTIRRSLDIYLVERLPIWLISHVEGHRMCPSKLAMSQEYARANNLPILRHVLLPRCKGFVATVQALRNSHVKHIYDITLAYFHRDRGFGSTPSLLEVLTGGLDRYRFHVHIDRSAIEDLPTDEASINRWLYDRYARKDALMAEIKSAFEARYKG